MGYLTPHPIAVSNRAVMLSLPQQARLYNGLKVPPCGSGNSPRCSDLRVEARLPHLWLVRIGSGRGDFATVIGVKSR